MTCHIGRRPFRPTVVEELLGTFPELPLLIVVAAAAILVRQVRRILVLLLLGLIAAMVLGVFAHEALAALTARGP